MNPVHISNPAKSYPPPSPSPLNTLWRNPALASQHFCPLRFSQRYATHAPRKQRNPPAPRRLHLRCKQNGGISVIIYNALLIPILKKKAQTFGRSEYSPYLCTAYKERDTDKEIFLSYTFFCKAQGRSASSVGRAQHF